MLAVNHPEVLGTLGERTHMPQKNTDGVLVVKERPNLVMLLLEHRRALEKTSRGAGMVASYEVAKAFALSAGLCAVMWALFGN
jgi:hypothetical protein